MHYGITLGGWGLIAVHIASEKISSVAGNTEEIFSVLGQLAAYTVKFEILAWNYYWRH